MKELIIVALALASLSAFTNTLPAAPSEAILFAQPLVQISRSSGLAAQPAGGVLQQ